MGHLCLLALGQLEFDAAVLAQDFFRFAFF